MYLIIYYAIFIIICFVLAFNKEQQISDVLSLQKIGFIVLFLSLIFREVNNLIIHINTQSKLVQSTLN